MWDLTLTNRICPSHVARMSAICARSRACGLALPRRLPCRVEYAISVVTFCAGIPPCEPVLIPSDVPDSPAIPYRFEPQKRVERQSETAVASSGQIGLSDASHTANELVVARCGAFASGKWFVAKLTHCCTSFGAAASLSHRTLAPSLPRSLAPSLPRSRSLRLAL
eukprot:2459283-Rhodomonas_salina.1